MTAITFGAASRRIRCAAKPQRLIAAIARALDAYVAKAYWNLEVSALPYLQMAAQRGLGTYEFEKVRTHVKQLS